jgi:hypothetical protein
MIILKSTKFQCFYQKRPHGFQNFIQTLLGYFSLQEDKVNMCGNINGAYTSLDPCRHLHLQQNLQRAQTCTIARSSWSEGQGCLATAFCSFSFFFMHCNLRGRGGGGGVPMIFSLFPHLFQCIFCIWVPNITLFSGPIVYFHRSDV